MISHLLLSTNFQHLLPHPSLLQMTLFLTPLRTLKWSGKDFQGPPALPPHQEPRHLATWQMQAPCPFSLLSFCWWTDCSSPAYAGQHPTHSPTFFCMIHQNTIGAIIIPFETKTKRTFSRPHFPRCYYSISFLPFIAKLLEIIVHAATAESPFPFFKHSYHHHSTVLAVPMVSNLPHVAKTKTQFNPHLMWACLMPLSWSLVVAGNDWCHWHHFNLCLRHHLLPLSLYIFTSSYKDTF